MPARQRRRRRTRTEYQGPRKSRLPFPLNILLNQKAFYTFFIVVMIAGIAATGLYAGGGGGRRTNVDVEEPVVEETPGTALTFDAPAPTIDMSRPYLATLRTDKGDIVIDLAPNSKVANSFAFLAGNGFYNGTAFFYVDKDFVAQAGDPTCKPGSDTTCSGTGGPGYTLQAEPTGLSHDQWSVAAPSLGGDDVHGSQFRILYQADPRLDGQETVFGKVIEGQEILESLNNLRPCSVVSSSAQGCDTDLSSALVIKEIIVGPKAV